MNGFVGGYRIDLEDRGFLSKTATPVKRMLGDGDLPERVDPRRSALAESGLLQTEDQLQIGSCQGQSLTENAELCYAIKTGRVIQFSRMFAYIASQMKDGIRTDSGSTLSGGTKAAKDDGFCPEEFGPYPQRYPGWGWLTQSMREKAKPYLLQSHTEIKQEPEVKGYIGSGIGGVQIGISWGNEMTPDANGCIRSFTGRGGGGHAVFLGGYVPDADVGQRSSKGYWYLLKNSWGLRWGVKGWAYVDPAAIAAMLRHNFTVFYGRSDMSVPDVRTVPHDFTKGRVIQI